LWNQLARNNRFDWLQSFRFLPAATAINAEAYDWGYGWIPFADYNQEQKIERHIYDLIQALAPTGLAFVAGPESIPFVVANLAVQILFGEIGSEVQPFAMHRSILPKSRLNPHLHLWCLQKV